jgi:hypothetical protein
MSEAEIVIRGRSPQPQRAPSYVDISARYCKLPRAKSGQQRMAGPRRFDDLAFRAAKLTGYTLLT